MKKALLASLFVASSQNIFAVRGEDIQDVKQRAAWVERVASISLDYVLHYELAVIIGTTAEYLESTKKWHFEEILKGADKNCSDDINLGACIRDLICTKAIHHNLHRELMLCDLDKDTPAIRVANPTPTHEIL